MYPNIIRCVLLLRFAIRLRHTLEEVVFELEEYAYSQEMIVVHLRCADVAETRIHETQSFLPTRQPKQTLDY